MSREGTTSNYLPKDSFKRGIVLAEHNLLSNPHAILDKPQSAKYRAIKFERRVDNEKQTWALYPHHELGILGAFDADVLLTVQKIATDQGLPLARTRLLSLPPLREICRMMGLNDSSGQNLKLIKQSLIRIAGSVISTNNFLLRTGKKWEDDSGNTFTLWSVYWFNAKLPNGELAQTITLELNAPFINNLTQYLAAPLDYDYCMSLTPVAKRIYQLTRLRFYGLKHSDYVRFEYPLLCELIPVKKWPHFSRAQQSLARAHDELKGTGWLKGYEWQGGRKSQPLIPGMPWSICYYPGPRAHEELKRSIERRAKYEQLEELTPALRADQWPQLDLWVKDYVQQLGDGRRGFYRLLGYLVLKGEIPEGVAFALLSETKVAMHDGTIKRTPSAYYTDRVKRWCKAHGKDLNQLLAQAKAELSKKPRKTTASKAVKPPNLLPTIND